MQQREVPDDRVGEVPDDRNQSDSNPVLDGMSVQTQFSRAECNERVSGNDFSLRCDQ